MPEAERRGRAPANVSLVATPPRRTPCSKDAQSVSLHRGAPNHGGYIDRLLLAPPPHKVLPPNYHTWAKECKKGSSTREMKLDKRLGEERTRENMRAPGSQFAAANFYGCFLVCWSHYFVIFT
jgi:hypothetical protein